MVSAGSRNSTLVSCVMFRGLRMYFERITVLGSNGSDCFLCWAHDHRPKCEARQYTLISDRWRGVSNVARVQRAKYDQYTILATLYLAIGWTGRSLGAHAEHIWTLTPQNNGTLVTTEESMEGWSIQLLKLVSPKFLDNSLDAWLQNLKTKAELPRPSL
jgi:hypothetical protein